MVNMFPFKYARVNWMNSNSFIRPYLPMDWLRTNQKLDCLAWLALLRTDVTTDHEF